LKNKNQLTLFPLTMIVIGLVIGMGIFRTSRDAAAAAVNPQMFFGAWIIGGIIAFCGALTYAEIGSRYPVTGGYYKIFSYAYHPSVAFAINCSILISNAASLSGVALIGSEYITPVIFPGAGAFTQTAIAITTIALFYGVNRMGLRMSSRTLNVLMLIKIAMLLVVIAAIFIPAVHNPNPIPWEGSEGLTLGAMLLAFGVALKATSFTYGGYQQTINFGGEVHRPATTVPRSIFIGIAVIVSFYLAVSYAYFKIIGLVELRDTSSIASVVAERMFGPVGSTIASVLLFVAVLAYVNVVLLSNPRVMFAMSEDGILPRSFQRKDEGRDVLTVSLTVFAAICIVVLFFADTFDKILSFVIFLDSIGMATSAATIFILRKRTRHLDNTGIYKMRMYPLLPAVFVLAYLFVGTVIAITNPEYALIGTAVFAGLLGIYFITRKYHNIPNGH
jgi:basic amino acid/polyamine antiporter, APA family